MGCTLGKMESQVEGLGLFQVREEEKDMESSSKISKGEFRCWGREKGLTETPKPGDLRDCFITPKWEMTAFDP